MSFSYYTRRLSPTFHRQLAQLKELKPLPKVAYSWSLPDNVLSQPDERHYEYVRISRAACLQAEYATQAQIETCVHLCQPSGASIGLNLKPFHNVWPADLPPTDMDSRSELGGTPYHEAELAVLRDALIKCRTVIMKNLQYSFAAILGDMSSNVQVTAIMLDSEVFYVKPDDPAWNAAITAKYDAVYDLCKEIFPAAKVIWYEWGWEAAPSKTGWQLAPWYSPGAKADALSCDLYTPCELHRMRETFTRTVDEAKRRYIKSVVPYIALASGYQRAVTEFQTWNSNWLYGREYAYELGREINVPWFSWPDQQIRFAPWNFADCVVFYPPPWDSRTPGWLDYFQAYCFGCEERAAVKGKP
jgi:hypothetical protein